MRPDDETRDPNERDDAAADETGEPEVPPSTWAGRKRAGGQGEQAGGEEPEAEEPPADGADEDAEDDESSGFTEEFEAIERQLDEELDELGTGQEYTTGDDDSPEADEAPAPADATREYDAVEEAEARGEPVPEADAADDGEDAELESEGEAAHGEADDEAADEPAAEDAADGTEGDGEAVDEAGPVTAEDAALAGLKARAGDSEGWEKGAGEQPVEAEGEEAGEPATVAAAIVTGPDDEEPAPRAKPLWARFLAASLIIVASMAAATSISALVFVADFAKGLGGIEGVSDRLDEVEGGDPQTILILGSDKRPTEDTGRSDTTILLRVDPDRDVINLLSIPRDLKVTIPGLGVDKFNAAYSYGGPPLTLDVVKRLTGRPINHVVNINFTGFADAVDALNCVFIDVDRQYYVPEGTYVGGTQYSVIDPPINAGYQKLCGLKALQYVRYRIGDNDLVRSARQQDFIREARQKIEPTQLLTDPDYRYELLDVFKEYTTSDDALKDTGEVLDLMKTFLGAHDASVNEVQFPAELGESYVEYNNKALQAALDEFEGVTESESVEAPAEKSRDGGDGRSAGGDAGGESRKPGGGEERKPEKEPEPEPEPDVASEGPAMIDATGMGEAFARKIAKAETKGGEKMINFPILYPTALAPGSTITEESRAFPIDGPKKYYGYKLVVELIGPRTSAQGLTREYYGLSGTNWDDPPILENPSETREIDGRNYLLFFDAGRLRLVGWKEGGEAYWVNNSLLHTLEDAEMLAVARSVRERGA